MNILKFEWFQTKCQKWLIMLAMNYFQHWTSQNQKYMEVINFNPHITASCTYTPKNHLFGAHRDSSSGWMLCFFILKTSSSSFLEINMSEMMRESQTMTGVSKRMRPKGTIQSCLFVGWYLCSHHPSIEPPIMLINKDEMKIIK